MYVPTLLELDSLNKRVIVSNIDFNKLQSMWTSFLEDFGVGVCLYKLDSVPYITFVPGQYLGCTNLAHGISITPYSKDSNDSVISIGPYRIHITIHDNRVSTDDLYDNSITVNLSIELTDEVKKIVQSVIDDIEMDTDLRYDVSSLLLDYTDITDLDSLHSYMMKEIYQFDYSFSIEDRYKAIFDVDNNNQCMSDRDKNIALFDTRKLYTKLVDAQIGDRCKTICELSIQLKSILDILQISLQEVHAFHHAVSFKPNIFHLKDGEHPLIDSLSNCRLTTHGVSLIIGHIFLQISYKQIIPEKEGYYVCLVSVLNHELFEKCTSLNALTDFDSLMREFKYIYTITGIPQLTRYLYYILDQERRNSDNCVVKNIFKKQK